MKPVPANLVLLVLAMAQVPLPTRARPGTRHSRQDLRMLPANSTGTPQDQALASGVVLEESVQIPVAGPANQESSTAVASMASMMTTTSTSPPAAGGLRRTLLAPASPAHGQERTKHTGLASDFSAEDSNIVFPSPQIKPQVMPGLPGQPKFAPIPGRATPACAKGSTFCTDVDNYPENYLQTMLRSATAGLGYREYFGNDVIAEGNITQRIDANDELPLCPYEETVVYPKVAKNKEDKWLYVVNQDHFVQGVRIETCLNTGTACQLAENFPYGYTTSCRQKYILRKLVALNPEGQTQTDMFRLPSCCSCYVSRGNVSSRRSNMSPAIKKTGSRKR